MAQVFLIGQPGSRATARLLLDKVIHFIVAPFIWGQGLEGKKRHRTLLVWGWLDAKMGASDESPSTCWERKIIWTPARAGKHLHPYFPPCIRTTLQNCCSYQTSPPGVSAEESSRSLELAQLPTSLQERAHAFSSTSCVLNLTQIRKSKDLPEQQGPRTGGPGVHRLDNCDLHSLTFILPSSANSPNFLSEPTFPSKHGILWPLWAYNTLAAVSI